MTGYELWLYNSLHIVGIHFMYGVQLFVPQGMDYKMYCQAKMELQSKSSIELK